MGKPSLSSILLSLGCALLLLRGGQGPARDSVVRAQAFVLVDEKGRIRAELGLEDEEPVLRLLDEHRQPRLELALDEGRPAISLFAGSRSRGSFLASEAVKPRAQLLVDEAERPSLILGEQGADRGLLLQLADLPRIELRKAPGQLFSAEPDGIVIEAQETPVSRWPEPRRTRR